MSEKNNIVWEKYLQYFSEICAGARPMPAGLSAQSEDDMAKVVELQTQVLDMGIPEFVRRCAEAAGKPFPRRRLTPLTSRPFWPSSRPRRPRRRR